MRITIVIALVTGLATGCTTAPTDNLDTRATPPTSLTAPQGSIADPRLGETYEYELYTHCGLYAVKFDDRWWKANTPTSGQPLSPGSGTTSGEITLVREDLLRFTSEDGSGEFSPATSEPPPCQ